jgi:hypothetical protein
MSSPPDPVLDLLTATRLRRLADTADPWLRALLLKISAEFVATALAAPVERHCGYPRRDI